MTIIFDLDGTLIDSSERLYRLFQSLVPESRLTKEKYWELKRNKVCHKDILSRFFPKYSFEDFNSAWMKQIELDDYLKLDDCYPDTIRVLKGLKGDSYMLVLLTARQSKIALYRELERFKMRVYFDNILVTEGKETKDELLEDAIFMGCVPKGQGDLFISDMGKDIQIGNKLGYKTVAIDHGFMSKEMLKMYHPDYLVHSLSEIIMIKNVI